MISAVLLADGTWVGCDTETRISCIADSEGAALQWIKETNLSNEIARQGDEIRRLHVALNHICSQYLTEEMDQPDDADFENGYNEIVKFARKTLKHES